MSDKWYVNGLKFECTKCGHCCTGAPGYVWVTLPEIYRIAEFLGMDDFEFTKRYVRKVHQKFSLIEMPNGDCVFYDQGCKIYPVRPTQCRTFPFWPEIISRPGAWKIAAQECPGMNQGELHSAEEIDTAAAENHS
ncbi:MAG TPA: YkgJ family cysteine cluster protein [Acidobacteriota bacterium]|jgi:Fe-S-cluster containining protein|nr:YkgJ family cysteine cluster protein [Acidobacteriota bacterium]